MVAAIRKFYVAFAAAPWYGRQAASRLWLVGLFWLALTLVFEFGMGFAQGQDLSQLFQAYTFRGGNIWPVVLVAALVSPRLAAYLRRVD